MGWSDVDAGDYTAHFGVALVAMTTELVAKANMHTLAGFLVIAVISLFVAAHTGDQSHELTEVGLGLRIDPWGCRVG